MAVGSWLLCASSSSFGTLRTSGNIASSAIAKVPLKAAATIDLMLFMRRFLPRLDSLLIIGFVDIEEAHPREAHLVDRALAVAHPIPRIGVVLVGRGVVVPRGDVDDRSRRQDRRDIVRVRIRDVPAELIVAD